MLMVRAVAGGLDDEELLAVMRQDPLGNAAVGHWQHTGAWHLISYNDTSHLLGTRPPAEWPLVTSRSRQCWSGRQSVAEHGVLGRKDGG
jgi:hypothetical protein